MQKVKHLGIKNHFVREIAHRDGNFRKMVDKKTFMVCYTAFDDKKADELTNMLVGKLIEKHRTSLNVLHQSLQSNSRADVLAA